METGSMIRVRSTIWSLRGGSWNNNDNNCRVANRNNNNPDNRNNNNGFRVLNAINLQKFKPELSRAYLEGRAIMIAQLLILVPSPKHCLKLSSIASKS